MSERTMLGPQERGGLCPILEWPMVPRVMSPLSPQYLMQHLSLWVPCP